jgi:hypothetical protein
MKPVGLLPVVSAALLAVALPSCSGDGDCSAADDRCDGNVAQACTGTGSAASWETRDCGETATCLKGMCYPKPFKTCTAAEEGTGLCDVSGRYPGRCTEDGAYLWDLATDCRARSDQECRVGLNPEDEQGPRLALCVYPLNTCPPGSSHPLCHDDVLTDCAPIGYEALVQDCAADGKVCRNGACTAP